MPARTMKNNPEAIIVHENHLLNRNSKVIMHSTKPNTFSKNLLSKLSKLK